MNEKLLRWIFKAAATFAQVKASGLTQQLADEMRALNHELTTSVLAPRPDGTAWTEDHILALVDDHDRLLAEIRANVAVAPA